MLKGCGYLQILVERKTGIMARADLLRIIDANLNRAGEGLRVIEDFLRFRGWADLSARTRGFRHNVGRWRKEVGIESCGFRLLENDPGKDNSHSYYDNDVDLLLANLSRIKESLRVLEESFRAMERLDLSLEVQEVRFGVYELEIRLIGRKDILTGKGNLYLIFDLDLIRSAYPKRDGVDSWIILAQEFFESGVDILQVRFSCNVSDRDVLGLINGIRKILPKDKALFVNNRPDLAYLTGVNLHVGQGDVPPMDARRILGWFSILGQSCHSSEEIERALNDDAVDYFTIGPIFPTQTKPEYASVGTELLEQYWRVKKPFVIIGGLSAENVKDLVKYRPWAVAVCRDVLLSRDPKRRIREYKDVLGEIV